MATQVINPDLAISAKLASEALRNQISNPATLRAKLKSAGLSPHLARAAKPEIPAPRWNKRQMRRLMKVSEQRRWASMLVFMCTGERV